MMRHAARIRRWHWLLAAAAFVAFWAVLVLTFVRAPEVSPAHASAQRTAGTPQALWQALTRVVPPAMLAMPAHAPSARPPVARWADPGRTATLADAQQQLLDGAFTRVPSQRSEGVAPRAYWYALPVQRGDTDQERWLLAVGAPFLDDVQIWLMRQDARLQHVQLGDHFAGADRQVRARLHTLAFNLAPDEEAVLWVRTQSSGVMNISLELTRPDSYFAQEVRFNAALGVFMGMLALATLTYALIGGWLRDRIMLGYAAFLATLIALYLGTTGLLLELAPGAPWWLNDLLAGIGAMGPLYAAAFMWIHMLDMRTHFPRMWQLYTATGLVTVLLLPLAMTGHYWILLGTAYHSGALFAPVNLYMAWKVWRHNRDRLRLIYLAAFGVYAAGVHTLVLAMIGWLPANALTLAAYPASTLIHTVIMAVAMAIRITSLRDDKVLADRMAAEHRRFLAMLTHEFRNPLASVDRSANLLQAMGTPQVGQVQSRMASIRQQVRRLNTLVDSFLMVGDGRETGIQPNLSSIDVRPLLDTLCQALGPEQAARLRLHFPRGEVQAVVDARLLRLALNNLIDNALRYSPEDGLVNILVERSEDGMTRIAVSDQGPGLSEADIARLGEPYHRGTAAIGTQGTGLGYHFCRQIALAHGGTIRASQVRPHGLCVTLSLP